MALKCYTAPGKVFECREELTNHYKSDWHRFNLKRKVAKLLPVDFDTFSTIQAQARNRSEKYDPSGKNKAKGADHLKKSKLEKRAAKRKQIDAAAITATESKQAVDSTKDEVSKVGVAVGALQLEETCEENETVDHEEEYGIDLEEARKPVDVCESIFDLPKRHISASLEENLEYMHKNFGFFVPDCEHLADPEGLFKYCMQKVK